MSVEKNIWVLPLILLTTAFLPAQEASMQCVDSGVTTAAVETQPWRGPDGLTAVLKVSSSDDYSKNSHLCAAEYKLVIRSAGADAPVIVDLTMTDGDWDRKLSLRPEGFSHDGKRVFGILSEPGKYPWTTLLDYDTAAGKVQLVDIGKSFAHIVTPACPTNVNVIGTTEAGAIVLDLNSTGCAPATHWLLNANHLVRPLPQGMAIQRLYGSPAAN
jgi:hypothetical protein